MKVGVYRIERNEWMITVSWLVVIPHWHPHDMVGSDNMCRSYWKLQDYLNKETGKNITDWKIEKFSHNRPQWKFKYFKKKKEREFVKKDNVFTLS